MNFLWISGWAVPPAWLEEQARGALPKAEHLVVSPMDAAPLLSREEFDVLGGYSLGALWLLKQQRVISPEIPVVLLAPIFAFTAEQGQGGRVALAQLKLQRRRLRGNAPKALVDFFKRAGLADLFPIPGELTPAQIAVLDEELGWLETWRAATPPVHWMSFVGSDDLLLNASILKNIWPALQVIPDAGHAPGPLLQAAAKFFPEATR